MSTVEVSTGVRLKQIFTQFDNKKLRRVLVAIFLFQAALFLYLYLNKVDAGKVVLNQIPVTGQPQFLFNIYGTEKEPLRKPMAVLELDQKIYVSDTDNHRIQVFDYNGNPIKIIGAEGKEKGQFEFPYGLAADAKKQLYVCDITNGNISVLSSQGEFIKYFGNNNDLKKPAGIYIDGDTVYVADIGLHKVIVLDMDGKKLREIGAQGTEPGQLRSPNAVCVSQGKVYVSDTGNDRVQIFSPSGQYLSILDGAAKPGGESNLLAPRGVSVDGKGTIYVVNNLIHRIHGYDQNNQKLFTFGAMGNEPEQFYLPTGSWVDGQGRIYITDTINQRVDVYQN